MKKIIILFSIKLLFSFNLIYGGIKFPSKPVFIGKQGKLYDITEPDMWEEIVQKSKEVNESFFYNYIQKEIDKAFIVNQQLPICNSLKLYKYEPIYTVKKDIYANGRLLYPKGYSFNVLEHINKLSVLKPILYFGGLENNISKTLGLNLIKKYKNMIFVVTKGHLKKLAEKYPYKIARASDRLINAFNIKCNSTIIFFGRKYLYILEIPINKLTTTNYDKIKNIIATKYKELYDEREK